jgi:hypothetical protein
MPILLFAASMVFLIWVGRLRKIRLLSPYGVFIAFQVLYNIFPWASVSFGLGSMMFSLLADQSIVNIQLVLSSTANLCFGAVFLFFYKDVRFQEADRSALGTSRRNYLWLAAPLFLITVALCEKYGWHQFTFAHYAADSGEILGGMYTVTAYFKFAFVGVYLYYLYRFGLDKGAWILLAEHIVVLVVDGARATFLPVFLVTMFMLIDKASMRKRLKYVYILALLGFILSMATRALIFEEGSLLEDVAGPVTIEGVMGDYSSLQSIYGVERLPSPSYSYGASYVLDPFIWLIPQSIGRERFLFFNRWTDQLAPILSEEFSPLGGFYYVSEAVAAFSYLGPALVTTVFAFVLVWVDRHKNSHRLLYLAWMPTIGLMFIKVPFDNGFKIFLIQFLIMKTIFLASKVKLTGITGSNRPGFSRPLPLQQQ